MKSIIDEAIDMLRKKKRGHLAEWKLEYTPHLVQYLVGKIDATQEAIDILRGIKKARMAKC